MGDTVIYTNTSLSCLRRCPRKYDLRYNLGWRPRQDSEALFVGTLWHDVMDMSHPIEDGREKVFEAYSNDQYYSDEIKPHNFMGMLLGYAEVQGFLSPDKREQEFRVPLINPDTGRSARDCMMGGKIDGLIQIDGDWWVVEYKTSSGINVEHIQKLDMDYQIAIYFSQAPALLGESVAGVQYDIVKKCGLKFCGKDNDDLDFYENRVREWYHTNKETAFFRQRIRLRDIQVERQLWMQHKYRLFCASQGTWIKHTENCAGIGQYTCEFYPYCSSGDSEMVLESQYTQDLENLHPELGEKAGE